MQNKDKKHHKETMCVTIKLVLGLLLLVFLVTGFTNAQTAHDHEHLVMDPVCGMKVDIHKSNYKFEYRGKTYYFCSEKCLESFKKQPDKYVEDKLALAKSSYKQNPENIEAGIKYGNALIEEGHFDEARNLFLALLQKANDPKHKAEISFKLGLISTKQRKFDQAISEYKVVLDNYPGTYYYSGAAINTAAILYQVKDELNPAFDLLSRAIKSGAIADDHLQTAYKLMFMMNYDLKDFYKAKEFLEKMNPETREDEHISDSIWVIYLMTGNEEMGRRLLKENYEKVKDDYFGLYKLAYVALDAKVLLNEALEWIERANDISGGKKFYILETYSRILWELGRYKEAVLQLEKAIENCQNESAIKELNERLQTYNEKLKQKGGKK